MEATGTMPADMPPMAFSTAMGNIPSNATGINSLNEMPAIPTMTGAPSMLDMMGTSCKIDMLWNWYTIDACFLSHSWQIKSRGMFAGSCIGVILLVLSLEALRRLGREYDAFIINRARQRRMYLHENPPGLNNEDSITKNPLGHDTSGPSSAHEPRETGHHQATSAISATDQHDRIFQSSQISNGDAPSEPRILAVTNGENQPPSQQHKSPCLAVSSEQKIQGNAETGQPWNTGVAISPRMSNFLPEEVNHRPSPVEQVVRALLHTLQFGVAYIIMLLAMYYNGYLIICIFIGAFLGSLIFSWEHVTLGKQNDACQVTKCCG